MYVFIYVCACVCVCVCVCEKCVVILTLFLQVCKSIGKERERKEEEEADEQGDRELRTCLSAIESERGELENTVCLCATALVCTHGKATPHAPKENALLREVRVVSDQALDVFNVHDCKGTVQVKV